VLVSVALAISAGCRDGGPTAPRVPLGREFTLATGQSVALEGGRLTIAFDRVESDSRCPEDVVCVWEGDAAITLAVRQGSGAQAKYSLHTSGRLGPREITHGSYQVQFVRLDPLQPRLGGVPPTAYRATLLVTGGG
jgi:hypothetical protein